MKVAEFFEILQTSDYLNYINVCRARKESPIEKYELHHIYPRSFEDGKIDEDYNLIRLTRVEHLRAHLLLVFSLEKLGRTGRSYIRAVKAVNFLFLVDWKKLTDDEKLLLADKIEDLVSISQKSLHAQRPQDDVEKIRKAWTPEKRQAWSIRLKGRVVSEETRKRMSEANRRRPVKPMQGKTQSPETRAAISRALKGRVISLEQRKRISEAARNRKRAPHSELTKEKMSQTAKGRIVVWKLGKKTYCREETLNQFLESGYTLTKKESLTTN